jgi:hypothetical protein
MKMKKLAYLTMMFVTLTLMSFSCCKDDDDPIVPQTLAEKYPNWVNLTWYSTDGDYSAGKYPKLSITITDNIVTIIKKMSASGSDIVSKYTAMNVSTGTVTFSSVYEDYNGLGTSLTCTGVSENVLQITLTCAGNTYVLNKP